MTVPQACKILFIVLIVVCFSCEKEKIVEVERISKWSANEHFIFSDKIKVNALSTENNLYLLGPKSISSLSVEDGTLEVEHALIRFDYPLQYKLPITERVFAGVDHTALSFYATRNPVFGNHSVWIDLAQLDPDFGVFELPGYQNSVGPVINPANQCLVPYLRYQRTEEGILILDGEPAFALINLDVENLEGNDRIDTLSVELIEPLGDLGSIISLHVIGNSFYATGANKTIRFDEQSNIEEVFSGRLYKIFTLNGFLYAFTEDALYRSDAGGNIWNKLGNVDPDFKRLNYGLIDGQLIGFINSQLFSIEITDTGLVVEELENDGLFGHEITAVNLFAGNVYVSTLTGVFNSPIETFFELKP